MKEKKYYSLGKGEAVLRVDKDDITWFEWRFLKGSDNKPCFKKFYGNVMIDDKKNLTMLMPVSEGAKEERFKDFNELVSYKKSLPVWDRTKYYLKLIKGGNSEVFDCKTNKPAPGDEGIEDLRKLLRDEK